MGEDFSFDPPFEDFAGLTFNPLTKTFFMTDNKLDALFEIDRTGLFIRQVDISDLKHPDEDGADVEGVTWMYGTRFAMVMEGGEEMAIVNIDKDTTALLRQDAMIFDLSGDPKGIAYQASDDSLFWVSQADPMRVVKTRLNEEEGTLEQIWNKSVELLPMEGLADIAVFPRLSPHLLLLSQDTPVIMEVDMTANLPVLISSFSLAQWNIPRPGAMAFHPDGSFVVVGKHLGGSPEDDFNVFVPTGPILNQFPVADAGNPFVTALDFDGTGAEASIDGSFSFDPDGAIIRYQYFVNGVLVEEGYGPSPSPLSFKFDLGISTVSLIVEDDAFDTNTALVRVAARRWTPDDRLPSTFPQPNNFPAVSLNYVHPGALRQEAEFFVQLNETGQGEIHVFDQIGRRVKLIKTPTLSPGRYREPWDLRNEEGTLIGPGVYYILIKTPGLTVKEKLVVVR